MASTKKKFRPLTVLVSILVALVALIAIVLISAIAYFRLSVLPYYAASEKGFKIPDITEGFVPQGMHYDERSDSFFLTGYSSADEASPVFVVNAESGETTQKVRLLKEDGSNFHGHAGGLAIYDDYVYIAGGDDRCLYVYSYSEILGAENGGGVRCLGSFSTEVSEDDGIDISFVEVHDGIITVGEFYREEDYPTLPTHHMTTAGGDEHRALALSFPLSADAPFGIIPTPLSVYSITDCVQGMCVSDGKIYLSISYGVSFSHILEYDQSLLKQEGEMTVLGRTVPLYALDSVSLTHDYKIAPMSEELAMVDGELYIFCESASDKYLFGRLIGATWCYKTDLAEMQ